MALQTIDIGIQGNDGTGDAIREAFRKVNDNFLELYAVYDITGRINFTRLNDAPASYSADQIIMASHTQQNQLTARNIVSSDNSLLINVTDNSKLDLKVSPVSILAKLSSDTAPELAAPLNANKLPIGRLSDPSPALVNEYNAVWAYIGSQISTTINELPVTVNYGINNYVAGAASNVNNNVAGTYRVSAVLKTRDEPLGPQTTDPDYDVNLTGNYVATETVQRKHLVYRGGDTMTGTLYLNDHPAPLNGSGQPNGISDIQAVTKFYTDTLYIKNSDFPASGIMTVVYDGLDANNNTYSTEQITTTGQANSIVKTDASGNIQGVGLYGEIFGNINTTSISTGNVLSAGTITGNWSLSPGSKLSATYADIAENYEGDTVYEPGTVVIFGGQKEVTRSYIANDTHVAGVVTTNPAHVLNENQTGNKVCIALVGRVPCKVIGRVKKGDLLTTSNTPGHAMVAFNPVLGSIIGKALQDKDTGEIGIIEIAVGRG